MKEVYLKQYLNELSKYPIEVINCILKTIDILDENYGAERNIDAYLGGYVLIVENIVDIEILKQDKLVV